MKKRSLMSAPFAHLFGLAPRAEEDDPKSRKAKVRRAEDEDDDPDAEEDEDEPKSKKAKGKRAEDDESGQDAEEDDPDAEEDEDEPKSRKAKGKGKRAEEDDEDPDAEEEEDEPKSARAAVAADRRRCARIVAHGLKHNNVEQACVFAFDTNMSATSAISALNAAGAAGGARGGRSRLQERMAAGAVKPVGSDDGDQTPAGMTATAAAIVRAAERAQGR